MNDLAALLGGGAAPAAPLPADPSLAGPDPLMAALGGGMPADPMAMGGAPMGAPAPGQYASTDPAFVGSVLEQLLMAKQADHASLDAQAAAAIAGNPLMQALLAGAPVTPGAGQDAQGIAPMGDIAPDPSMPF